MPLWHSQLYPSDPNMLWKNGEMNRLDHGMSHCVLHYIIEHSLDRSCTTLSDAIDVMTDNYLDLEGKVKYIGHYETKREIRGPETIYLEKSYI